MMPTHPAPPPRRFFSSLYWRIAITFLLLLTLLASLYVYLTAYSARTYFEATHQRLNREVAAHIATFMPPFEAGQLHAKKVERIFFNVMVMNPSVEVYLLSPAGEILSYYAPHKTIQVKAVALQPIQRFIQTSGTQFILGDDPRHLGIEKIFSAAEVVKNGRLQGYIYVVLASEAYGTALGTLLESHGLQLGTKTMLITLVVALTTGLLAFWFITKNINHIIHTVSRFRQGDLQARIHLSSAGELRQLADTFNEMADTLLQNIEELKQMEKLRRELIANVSHDIRTPIATVHGYAETILLKKSSLSEAERDRYTGIILQSTERLKRLVEELFELSKLEAKEITLHPEPFVLGELLHEVYDKLGIIAHHKDIALFCQFCENPTVVYADIALMERVLQNLTENAIKYTPPGGTVTLRLDQVAGRLQVSVTDTGPGIPLQALPHLFERYGSSNENSTNGTGAGLGLLIVKKYQWQHSSTLIAALHRVQ